MQFVTSTPTPEYCSRADVVHQGELRQPPLAFLFYISYSMCLFWEFHNKMTVIYHYKPLYHLVNKRPLTSPPPLSLPSAAGWKSDICISRP